MLGSVVPSLHTWLICTESAFLPQDPPIPSQAPLLPSSCLCLRCTQLLSGRISRQKPYDLLIRFPKDSVKLKPGPRNSYKQSTDAPVQMGPPLRTGSSFPHPLTILLSELKRPASSQGSPSTFIYLCKQQQSWAQSVFLAQCSTLLPIKFSAT